MNELPSLLTFAQQAAVDAGTVTLQYFQRSLTVEQKHDASPVTIADRSSERLLRNLIHQRFPEHAVLGEEDGLSGPEHATYRWVLDPIDGTKTFVRGVPLYGVLIGLLREEQPVLGVVHMPALQETVAAAHGLGCRWNGEPCRVSSIDRLDQSLVVGTIAHGYQRYGKDRAFQRILQRCGLFRTWGDCYGYLLVATGRAEAMLDPIMSVWDAAAMLPILQEAGGTYTDWRGTPTIHHPEGLASNTLVLPQLLAAINEVED